MIKDFSAAATTMHVVVFRDSTHRPSGCQRARSPADISAVIYVDAVIRSLCVARTASCTATVSLRRPCVVSNSWPTSRLSVGVGRGKAGVADETANIR